jgi:peptidoglycan/LPS O-acetylase OafA/YrhL
MSYVHFPHPVPMNFWVFIHLWSLSVEEQFYFFWPVAIALAFRYRNAIAFGLMALAVVSRFICLHFTSADPEFFAPCLADSLAAGCLLAIWRSKLRTPKWMTNPAFFVFLIAITLILYFRFQRSFLLPLYFGGLIPILIAICVHIAIVRRDSLLNNAGIRALGVLSYSLYLWQQPFLSAGGWWTRFPLNVVLALACACLSYRFVEQPMLRWKTKRPKVQLTRAQEELVSETA